MSAQGSLKSFRSCKEEYAMSLNKPSLVGRREFLVLGAGMASAAALEDVASRLIQSN
jgi:hypothetical protein